jgi:hypothetical protein
MLATHDNCKPGGPEKVRTKTKKPGASASANRLTVVPQAARTGSMREGALVEQLRAFVGLVGKDGAKALLNDLIDRL